MLVASLLALSVRMPAPQDVTYQKIGDQELQMTVFQPADYIKKPAPAVMVVHGGAWMAGSRQEVAPFCERIAANGMIAASISYRLAPASHYPAMIDDVQTAVRFFRANAARFGASPDRIGACGFSAGGQLVLLLGTTDTLAKNPALYPNVSSRVKAVFDLFGPYDMTDSKDFPPAVDYILKTVLGKERKDATEEIKAASPATYLTKDDAPIFIYQGLNDPLVPQHQARALEAKLGELGIKHRAVYLEGVGHEVPLQRPEVRKAVADGIAFLKANL